MVTNELTKVSYTISKAINSLPPPPYELWKLKYLSMSFYHSKNLKKKKLQKLKKLWKKLHKGLPKRKEVQKWRNSWNFNRRRSITWNVLDCWIWYPLHGKQDVMREGGDASPIPFWVRLKFWPQFTSSRHHI